METEFSIKDGKRYKEKLKIRKNNFHTYVIFIVVNKEKRYNTNIYLSCKDLLPLNSYNEFNRIIPIGGYVYNQVNDSFMFSCVEYVKFGYIPFSIKLELDTSKYWEVYAPLTEEMIIKHLTSSQNKDLQEIKENYKTDNFHHQYIQFIGANNA